MIRVDGIAKTYRSGRGHVQALEDVSCVIETGRRVAVIGKSGSGKTTFLNCLGGLERPEKGRVICFGVAIHALSETALCRFQRQQVGFVFQSGNLLSCLTAFDNIAFPLTLNGIGGRKKAQRVQELLEKIGLPGTGAALPHELSGGEVQRIAVARALAHSPRLLLADEPTASLDSSTARNLIQLMFDLGKEQECTLVVSTHDPELIELMDDSLYLKDGKIIPED
ncbi:MAG TPA: ABC transporter ATP-binding protein [Candidatus Competibacteraceae bacterium]|nr:ABC transporter ATP-binding protein [Candidatus Competibacteraceae bacterium]